ncbi:MAG: lysophospholipid acyltransferase family protein [Patescibacteria group bacterium]
MTVENLTEHSPQTHIVKKAHIEEVPAHQLPLPFHRFLSFWSQAPVWLLMRTFLSLFVKFEVKGMENITTLKPGVIIASNHLSELDPILIGTALPFFSPFRPVFYTSRGKGLYQRPSWRRPFYGGTFFKILGAYPVIIGAHDYSKSLSAHAHIVNKGGTMVIFPEGTRSKDGVMKDGKGGVMYLSDIINAPIVPVAVDGTFHLTPRQFFSRKAHITLTFGEPIYARNFLSHDKRDFHDYSLAAQEVMLRIKRLKGEN